MGPGRPESGSQPLARSRQQLQQSKPMGERHSWFDIRARLTGVAPYTHTHKRERRCRQVVLHLLSAHTTVEREDLEKITLRAFQFKCRVCCVLIFPRVCGFYERACLFARNDAGMCLKENQKLLLFFFLLAVHCPALFLPLCVHTVQTGERRRRDGGWGVKRGLDRKEEKCL